MNYDYPELTLALQDMRGQTEAYQPTPFWADASGSIVDEIQAQGIERFRALPLPLNFFVPTYGVPGNSFTPALRDSLRRLLADECPQATKPKLALDNFLSGQASALSDYRVLQAADNPNRLPHLHFFSECTTGEPVEHFEFEGRRFSRSSLNYLLGLAMLKKHLPAGYVPRTILEIGGGFGTLGEILSASGVEDLRYIDVDIPPTSFVAQWYLQHAVGENAVTTYAMTREKREIDISSLARLSVLCAWQIEKLRGSVDLFVNFISFQEMEPQTVKNYLSHVDRLGARWLLLRNMREGKQKRTVRNNVGVENPIRGDDYIDMLPGYELVARNVHPFGLRTVDGYHSEILILRRAS
jgi:putative sugar O-methyltransferase